MIKLVATFGRVQDTTLVPTEYISVSLDGYRGWSLDDGSLKLSDAFTSDSGEFLDIDFTFRGVVNTSPVLSGILVLRLKLLPVVSDIVKCMRLPPATTSV